MYSDIRCLDSSMCQTHVTLKKNIKHEHSINVRSFLTINKGHLFLLRGIQSSNSKYRLSRLWIIQPRRNYYAFVV